jgi:hypothetical protein
MALNVSGKNVLSEQLLIDELRRRGFEVTILESDKWSNDDLHVGKPATAGQLNKLHKGTFPSKTDLSDSFVAEVGKPIDDFSLGFVYSDSVETEKGDLPGSSFSVTETIVAYAGTGKSDVKYAYYAPNKAKHAPEAMCFKWLKLKPINVIVEKY